MFQISKSAHIWFKKIDQKKGYTNAPIMDIYYMCFIVGVLSKKPLRQLEDGEGAFYSRGGWPGVYQDNYQNIIGLFLESELDRFKVDRKNKDSVRENVNKYLDTDNTTKLSNDAIETMNDYSYTGFIHIRDTLKEEPENLVNFLVDYSKIVKSFL